MSAATEQGIIMLASHFYENRDGSAGGLFPDKAATAGGAAERAWECANTLIRLGRDVVL
jgi:hypothetical protein